MRPTCPHCQLRYIREGGTLCNECLEREMKKLHEPEQRRQSADRDHRGEHRQLRTAVNPRALSK